jgi:GR25 family glycosyltransferase involved in LPS biosynthesis
MFYEIPFQQRFVLFINHLKNSFTTNNRNIETKNIEIHSTYIITTQDRADRRELMLKQLTDASLNFRFYYAESQFKLSHLTNFFDKVSLKFLSGGSISCALSHIKILQLVSKSPTASYYIIFEDDIILSVDFDDVIKDLTQNYPIGCDILFLGSRNKRKRDIVYNTNQGIQRSYNNRLGAYAYIVSNYSAKKILEYLLPLKLFCGGIDTAYGMLIRNRKIIAYQLADCAVLHNDKSPSNIFNPSNKSKKLHTNANTTWPLKLDKQY